MRKIDREIAEEHGRLHTEFHRERRIDRWTFTSPFGKHDEGVLVADVYLRQRHDYGIKFVAISNALPGKTDEDTDIVKLFARVEEQFRLNDMARHGIVWEEWLELEISGYVGDHEQKVKAALDIEYRPIKRGVDSKTGNVVTINNNHIVVPFPTPKRAGEKDPDGKEGRWGGSGRDLNTQFAYIPATPANVKAVKNLLDKMRELRVRLTKVLAQDVIQHSLSQVNQGVRLLEMK